MGMDVQLFWSKNPEMNGCGAYIDFRQWRKDFELEGIIYELDIGEYFTHEFSRCFRKFYAEDLIKLKDIYNGKYNTEDNQIDEIRFFYKYLKDEEKRFNVEINRINVIFR